ncbi:MAG: response regulator [Chloroflexi bacterium]|nr:response regulator [Chloroflexota bacterium]MDA8188916.1 response regulator [Dehalococcoidales bacterium]
MRSAKVLVVDDDATIVDFVTLFLESEGFAVGKASNGEEAIERVKRDRPDLVLLDVMMPVMDGVICCQTLKNDPSTQHLPVVMMSAQENLRGRMLTLGADDYLEKPFDVDTLLDIIERFVETRT